MHLLHTSVSIWCLCLFCRSLLQVSFHIRQTLLINMYVFLIGPFSYGHMYTYLGWNESLCIYFTPLYSFMFMSLLQVSFDAYVRLFNRFHFICIRVLSERALIPYTSTPHLSIHSCDLYSFMWCTWMNTCTWMNIHTSLFMSLSQVSFIRPFAYKSLCTYFTPLYPFMYMSLLQVSFVSPFAYKYNPFVVCL